MTGWRRWAAAVSTASRWWLASLAAVPAFWGQRLDDAAAGSRPAPTAPR